MVMLALIIPLGPGLGGEPTHPIVLPPAVWPPTGGGVPMPPIYYPPTPPPGIWPSPGHPAHPIAPGGGPPVVWPGPGVPTPPIYYPPTPPAGGAPPGIWPSPGVPTHPIYIPQPPGIWPSPGVPTPPIYYPPTRPSEPPSTEGDWAYSPIFGWVWVPSGEAGKPHPPTGPEVPTPA
jgi:hypothetical protein